MKQCQIKDCPNQVPEWSAYCEPHFRQMAQQQKAQQMQQAQAQPQPTPVQQLGMPPQGVYMPQQPNVRQPQPVPQRQPFKVAEPPNLEEEEVTDEGDYEEESLQEELSQKRPQRRVMPQRQRPQPRPNFQMPQEVDEKTRLDLKKVALQVASALLVSNENLMSDDFNELVNNLESLSVICYRIMVSYNENAGFQGQ